MPRKSIHQIQRTRHCHPLHWPGHRLTNIDMLLAKIQMYKSSLYSDLIVCQRDLVKGLRAVPQIGLQRRKASATSAKRCKFCNSNSEFPAFVACFIGAQIQRMNLKGAKKQLSWFHRIPSNIPKTLFESPSPCSPCILSVCLLNSIQIQFMHPPFRWQDTRTESCRKRSTMRATLSSERSFLRWSPKIHWEKKCGKSLKHSLFAPKNPKQILTLRPWLWKIQAANLPWPLWKATRTN